jgi:ADP-dependent NAD(P)H-hydrate dehydratase / NAD(P)H-hydrate epimerase
MDTAWHKQSPDKPLFQDLIWNKPENRQHAGKLLVIGGNQHEFAAPAEAYQAATKAGIGSAKVLLPSVLQKTIGAVLENGEFAPSNKSGSFSKQALAEWLDFAHWADGVLIAGDLGRNSETAIVLERFLEKYPGQVTITKDALEYFNHQPRKLFERKETTLVASIAQLQKLAGGLGWPTPIKFSMTIAQLAQTLYELTHTHPASIIIEHNGMLFAASGGQVSATKKDVGETWRVTTAASASVWWLQNPSKPFEALTTSLVV